MVLKRIQRLRTYWHHPWLLFSLIPTFYSHKKVRFSMHYSEKSNVYLIHFISYIEMLLRCMTSRSLVESPRLGLSLRALPHDHLLVGRWSLYHYFSE